MYNKCLKFWKGNLVCEFYRYWTEVGLLFFKGFTSETFLRKNNVEVAYCGVVNPCPSLEWRWWMTAASSPQLPPPPFSFCHFLFPSMFCFVVVVVLAFYFSSHSVSVVSLSLCPPVCLWYNLRYVPISVFRVRTVYIYFLLS